ncbi:TPA: hypothetical protein TUD09_001863 [Streptococcus equi subsp. zooepidemicus]|uniref:Uncharacterized protein n=1 Tax=Streptococcus equi subsp. ruminatorum CECT 5772 TaxID=1051981 RepID=A0A922T971_9STRE
MIAIEMILTGQEPIRALKKELDRRLVQSICAPLTLGRLHALQRRYDSEVSRNVRQEGLTVLPATVTTLLELAV